MATLKPALDAALAHEGVYSNDPDDVGAETFRGIARAFWPGWQGWQAIDACRRYADFPACVERPAFVAKLAPAVTDFYAEHFWQPIRGDLMASQPVANEVFEQAVNLGVGLAGRNLQLALNALNRGGKDWPDLGVDGRIGNGTLGALAVAVKRREAQVVKALNVFQGYHYLTSRHEKFVAGWLSRVDL